MCVRKANFSLKKYFWGLPIYKIHKYVIALLLPLAYSIKTKDMMDSWVQICFQKLSLKNTEIGTRYDFNTDRKST